MALPVRPLLVGPDDHGSSRWLEVALAVALFAATFGAYATDVFEIAGGVVFVPGQAALVGVAAAAIAGARTVGLAFGWLAAYAPLVAYHADHAFLGLSGRPLPARAAYFLEIEGWVVLGVEALVFGTVAWTAGYAAQWCYAAVRERGPAAPSG